MTTQSQIVGILDEIDFPDIKKSVEDILKSSLMFVSDVAYFFQVSLIKRERGNGPSEMPDRMTVRWHVCRPSTELTEEARPFLERGKPVIRYHKNQKTLLWDTIEAEVSEHESCQGLNKFSTESLFGEENHFPHVKNIYLADMTSEDLKKKAMTVISGEEYDYKSSFLLPIWINPIVSSPLAESTPSDQLVGVLSLDSGLYYQHFLEKKKEMKLVCSLTELMGRMIEAIYSAYYDFLGGGEGILSNTFYFKKMLHLIKDKENIKNLLLIYLDLNNFKQVNDEGGHEEGDKLLCSFGAELIRTCYSDPLTRGRSWLCRFGGDEFGLLTMPEEKDPRKFLLPWLRNNLCKKFHFGGYSVAPSIGIVSWKKIEGDVWQGKLGISSAAKRFRQMADDAMYASKKIYKALDQLTVVFYDISDEQIRAIKEEKNLKELMEINSWDSEVAS